MIPGFDFEAWTASDTPAAPTASVPSTSSRPVPREGDWECPSCKNINFAKRTRCNKCELPKKLSEPESKNEGFDDVTHLGGPTGLFKKGDWACSHCRNVNWARRNKCNVCNAPKPSNTNEPRMGRAGGHYDLQDPYDRQQHHSDDEEFDEFGRKKKKKKTGNQSNLESQSCKKSSKYSEFTLQGLQFPHPPQCYIEGRSMSMSSKSSRTSDYTIDSDYYNDE